MITSLTMLLAACVGQAAGGPGPFAFREVGPTGLELSEGGKPVFVYNFGMMLAPGFPESMRRSCYLHPVYAPDGTVLTDEFNKDHPHHRGISWMWPEVTVGGKLLIRMLCWKTETAPPLSVSVSVALKSPIVVYVCCALTMAVLSTSGVLPSP